MVTCLNLLKQKSHRAPYKTKKLSKTINSAIATTTTHVLKSNAVESPTEKQDLYNNFHLLKTTKTHQKLIKNFTDDEIKKTTS